MIHKIKELINVKKELVSITDSIKDNGDALNLYNEKFSSFEKELTSLKENQQQFLDGFKDNMDIIKNISEELKKEVYDFKLLKSQVQNKIVDKFEEEIKSELKINLDRLNTDLDSYNDPELIN